MSEQVDGEGDEEDVVVVDPVCGEPVLPGDGATVSLRHHGRTWRFCGPVCRAHFLELAERARMGEALKTGRFFSPDRRVRWGVA